MIDVLVVGAGPVGLATALYCCEAGLSVTVVDRRSGPIDKACGEGLLPAAVEALSSLGVSPTGQPIRGIRYLDGVKSVDALFAGGSGRGVRRTELQSALAAAVLAAGIPIVEASVAEVNQTSSAVSAAGLQARYLVAADGLHSSVRRSLGLGRPAPVAAPRFGQRRHFAAAPWTDLVEVHWASSAEAYVTPVGPDQVGVAVLSSRRESFDEQLAEFPALLERLSGSAASPVRGAGPLRQRTSRRVAGRVLLVGDAAGYVDALTGEGISVGLTSARSVADCLRRDEPLAYERGWRRASRRYRVLTGSLLATASRPVLRKQIVPAATAAPWLFGAAVNQLS